MGRRRECGVGDLETEIWKSGVGSEEGVDDDDGERNVEEEGGGGVGVTTSSRHSGELR